MEGQKKSNYTVIGIIVLVVLALVYGLFRYVKKQDSATPVTPQEQVANTPQYMYKNGTYTNLGDYFSPGGNEQIEVQVTLKDDVIVSAEVKSLATRPISVKVQGIFIENFKPLVIGKNINDVVLDKVSGSSLTPKGWNDAIEKIKAVAKV